MRTVFGGLGALAGMTAGITERDSGPTWLSSLHVDPGDSVWPEWLRCDRRLSNVAAFLEAANFDGMSVLDRFLSGIVELPKATVASTEGAAKPVQSA